MNDQRGKARIWTSEKACTRMTDEYTPRHDCNTIIFNFHPMWRAYFVLFHSLGTIYTRTPILAGLDPLQARHRYFFFLYGP